MTDDILRGKNFLFVDVANQWKLNNVCGFYKSNFDGKYTSFDEDVFIRLETDANIQLQRTIATLT